jgi:hypothetical protein
MSDLLGNRFLEVTKGQNGLASVFTNNAGKLLVLNRYLAWQEYKSLTNELRTNMANKNLSDDAISIEATNQLTQLVTNNIDAYYTNAFSAKYDKSANPNSPREARNYFWIPAIDTPALEDRLNAVAYEVEAALPNILAMTNQLAEIMSNANNAVSRLDAALAKTDPILTNVAIITGNLRDPKGSLGDWLIPTNLAAQLRQTLQSATATLESTRSTLTIRTQT